MVEENHNPLVLIVDDDKRNIITLSMCLREDYNLLTALNAKEALDIVSDIS